MEIRKQLVLDDEEITIIEEYVALIEKIANRTDIRETSLMFYFSDCCANDSDLDGTHNLEDIDNY